MNISKTMKHMKLAAALCCIGILVGCGQKTPDTQTKVDNRSPGGGGQKTFDIGLVTFAGYAPLYLAKEKGFFGDLDVRLHRIEEIANIRAGVLSKDLEAYLATLDIALDTDKKPVGVSIWAIDESAGGDGVVASKDIAQLSDLKGKTVAAEPGFPPYFILTYFLHENGMSIADIKFKDMKTQDASTAFISGSVDAAGVYEPYLSTAKNKREGSKVVVSSAQTPGLIVDQIFVRDDVLARKQDIEKVIAGWRKAVDFLRSSPDEANQIMAKAFNLKVDEFKDSAAAVRWLDLGDNQKMYGTKDSPGLLEKNFPKVRDVLRRNRPTVFNSQPDIAGISWLGGSKNGDL